jgi:metal-dependent amidase/aminoacylase/carboxypeptidase family protein
MYDEDFVMVESIDTAGSTASRDYLKIIDGHVETLSEDLRHISLSIHDNPELQYKEYHAHRVLTEYLSKQDWKVTPSAYGIETAFVAVYDTGRKGPVVSFNAEYGMLVARDLYHI